MRFVAVAAAPEPFAPPDSLSSNYDVREVVRQQLCVFLKRTAGALNADGLTVSSANELLDLIDKTVKTLNQVNSTKYF